MKIISTELYNKLLEAEKSFGNCLNMLDQHRLDNIKLSNDELFLREKIKKLKQKIKKLKKDKK